MHSISIRTYCQERKIYPEQLLYDFLLLYEFKIRNTLLRNGFIHILFYLWRVAQDLLTLSSLRKAAYQTNHYIKKACRNSVFVNSGLSHANSKNGLMIYKQ
jgi:hypothetical protein